MSSRGIRRSPKVIRPKDTAPAAIDCRAGRRSRKSLVNRRLDKSINAILDPKPAIG